LDNPDHPSVIPDGRPHETIDQVPGCSTPGASEAPGG
jgi:hypothetical protein